MDIALPDGSQRTLLARAAAGEEQACARLVSEHHAAMSKAAFVVAGDVETAQEAVQIAWSIAWRKLHTVRDPDRIRAWLVSIAANETRRLLKGRRRREIVELSTASAAEPPDPGELIGVVDLERALRGLSGDERALLAMRYVTGLDSTQIAQQLGISASGVRSRLDRLLERLRKELEDV